MWETFVSLHSVQSRWGCYKLVGPTGCSGFIWSLYLQPLPTPRDFTLCLLHTACAPHVQALLFCLYPQSLG